MDQRVIDQIRSDERFGAETSDAEIANAYADTLYAASINLSIAMGPIKSAVSEPFRALSGWLSSKIKR